MAALVVEHIVRRFIELWGKTAYNATAMKNVTIEKRIGALGCSSDITILFDERPKGVLKVDQDSISIPIGATEAAVQAEVVIGGRAYRSNAYFVLNGKCPKLYLLVSGSKMVLTVN